MHQSPKCCWVVFFYLLSLANLVAQIKIHQSLTVEDGLVQSQVLCIYEDRQGYLWFGTFDGLSRWDGINFTNFQFQNSSAPTEYLAIGEGNDGALYFGTSTGLTICQGGNFTTLHENDGLVNEVVRVIYKNRDGKLYLGTDAGVDIYANGKFEHLNPQLGLAHEIITAIREGKDGTLYVGTHGGGVSVYQNGKITRWNEQSGLANNFVRAICESRDGAIYVGTEHGVSVYQNGKLTKLRDKKGKFSTFNQKHGLASDKILSINGSKDGRIYFGTTKGVCIYQDGGFKTLSTQDGLANDFVWQIFPAQDGTVYFGTGGGLSIYKNGKFETIDVRRGLSNNTVLGILEDDAGKIYASTNKGINVLDFSNGQTKIRTLRHSDGLPSDECVLGAYYKDSRGRLWFGTVKGVVCYDPQKDRPNPMPPKVHLAQLRLFDREIPFNAAIPKLTFQHDENYLKFDFIGIDLQARGKVTYRHRLSGVDKDWVETNQRSVQYTNLDDGGYVFEVKAMNEWGYWSEPATLAFAIRPPFWEKWWFIAVLTLSLGGGLTYLITLRVRQLLAIERLRTRIAADLHDNIGAGLTEISILSEVGTKQIVQYPQNGAAEHFGKISHLSRALVDRMNDIVWLVNPKRDSLYDLIQQLGSSFEEISTCSGMVFRAMNLEVLRKVRLSMDYRQQLFHIFKEALHNSLKHSAAKEVILEAQMQGKRLQMRLKDDGQGFDRKKLSNGNGLENMKRRAEMIGGKLEVRSAAGKGTTVEFNGKLA